MMKAKWSQLTAALLLTTAGSATAGLVTLPGFTTGGSANYDNTSGTLTLTTAGNNQLGYAFTGLQDARGGFNASFEAYLGSSDGADGILFGYFEGNTAGGSGGSLGYGSGMGGFGIELDTHYNSSWDPMSNDHIGLVKGSASNHLVSTNVGNIEDGEWYQIDIDYEVTSTNKTISASINGFQAFILSNFDIVDYEGYFGFLGATGGKKNEQSVRDFSVSTTAVDPNSISAVPLPAAAWLFLTALGGLFGYRRRLKK